MPKEKKEEKNEILKEQKQTLSNEELKNNTVIQKMNFLTKGIYNNILKLQKPQLESPLRSLQNVKYDAKIGYFEIIGKTKSRTLTANSIKTFAQTLKMMDLSRQLIETKDLATKRDAYYQSKGAWGEAGFHDQTESDTIMDDIEAIMMVNREQLGFIPEEDGATVSGELTVIDIDTENGEKIEIDCSKFGSGGYGIPSTVEHLKFKTKAKFVLAVETAGTFQRLVYHKFWRKYNCILVSLKGVPSRATRRFLRKLTDECKIGIYVFTDGDPYGYLNIYRTLKVGSGNAAHINKYFCVPNAKYIGVTPYDIDKYKLPTHPLKDVDAKRIKDGIKNDPFIHHYKEWQKALEKMAVMKRRVEQQAFSAHSLNYVMDIYLPEKLSDEKSWLP